jgi:hypothetical protein
VRQGTGSDEAEDDLRLLHVRPEWCAAETGGVVLLLLLTSVRSAWLGDITGFIRDAAARRESGRVVVLTVVRLDKRYPLDVGFDRNLLELRDALRPIAASIAASAFVLEFGGFLATTMMRMMTVVGSLVRTQYPRHFDRSVVSAASWALSHVDAAERRSFRHYVDVVDRMKMELGCTT